MKYLLIIFALVFSANVSMAQKTEFTINKEKALYQYHKQQIEIVQSAYRIKSGEIADSLKALIVGLMESKPGFVSVEFIDDNTVIVEHQESLTQELVVKNLNRQGKIFILKQPEELIMRD